MLSSSVITGLSVNELPGGHRPICQMPITLITQPVKPPTSSSTHVGIQISNIINSMSVGDGPISDYPSGTQEHFSFRHWNHPAGEYHLRMTSASSCEAFEPWWHHQMETFYVLLALCQGNPPATGGFPSQRSVTRSFDTFFDLRLNQRFSKKSRRWWFETQSFSLWRHYDGKWTGLTDLYNASSLFYTKPLSTGILDYR